LTFTELQELALNIGVSFATSTQREISFNQLQEFALKFGVSSATSTSKEIGLQSIAIIPLENRGFIFKFNFNPKSHSPSANRKNSP
jgi:hypothetical protein